MITDALFFLELNRNNNIYIFPLKPPR